MCETPDKMYVHDIGNIGTIVFENVGAGGGVVKIYINIILLIILLPYIINIIRGYDSSQKLSQKCSKM